MRWTQSRLLDVAVGVLAAVCVVRIVAVLPDAVRQDDFAHFYASSRQFLAGEHLYRAPIGPVYRRYGFEFDPDIPRASYPPPAVWLFVPLAVLPVRVAFIGWLAVEVGCLAWLLAATRELLGRRISSRGWWWVCLAVICSPSLYWHFRYSQFQLLLAALVLAGYRWLARGQPLAACATVTLAGLLKLYPLALVPWFVWRSGKPWRAAAVVGGMVAVCVALGAPLWRDFFQYASGQLTSGTVGRSFHYSVAAFSANLGLAYDATREFWWQIGCLVGVGLIGGAYGLCARAKADRETEFCLLSVATLVGGITTQGHYFVFLVFPLTVMAARLGRHLTVQSATAFALLLASLGWQATMASEFLDRHLAWKVAANNLPLAGLLGLTWFFAVELNRRTNVS